MPATHRRNGGRILAIDFGAEGVVVIAGRLDAAQCPSAQAFLVADVLCYLRLSTELALRAKGILMMRESGFDVPVDEATRAKFAEMRYLEASIGKTGLLAIQPMRRMSNKDLWQLYMLGK
jgi:hypothetical protein